MRSVQLDNTLAAYVVAKSISIKSISELLLGDVYYIASSIFAIECSHLLQSLNESANIVDMIHLIYFWWNGLLIDKNITRLAIFISINYLKKLFSAVICF